MNNRRKDAIDQKELEKAMARQRGAAGRRGEAVNQIDDTTSKAKSKDGQPGEGDETSELKTDSELENGSQAKASRSEATTESKASGQQETEEAEEGKVKEILDQQSGKIHKKKIADPNKLVLTQEQIDNLIGADGFEGLEGLIDGGSPHSSELGRFKREGFGPQAPTAEAKPAKTAVGDDKRPTTPPAPVQPQKTQKENKSPKGGKSNT